jgi:hypothetical protein
VNDAWITRDITSNITTNRVPAAVAAEHLYCALSTVASQSFDDVTSRMTSCGVMFDTCIELSSGLLLTVIITMQSIINKGQFHQLCLLRFSVFLTLLVTKSQFEKNVTSFDL